MRFGIHCRLWTTGWSKANIDLIDHARALGFSVFEVTLVNLAAVDPVAIRRRAEATGMELYGTMGLSKDKGLATTDRATREQTLAFLKAAVETAREMGARHFGGMLYAVPGRFTGRGPTPDEVRWLVEGLSEVAVFAQKFDVTILVEPVNRYETYLLNTAAQAQVVVDSIGQPNVGLLLDTYHMNIEEQGIAATIRRHAKSLRHLHLNESDRGTLGRGNIDWVGLFAALKEIGYAGVGSIESFGVSSPELGVTTAIWRELFASPDELAREGLAFLRRLAGETR
jgi:D-psicose/D-tagatose/L-ribulose 3-epimerase